jgi:hypothetical protein
VIRLTIGDTVECVDGISADLARLVIDPVERSLTHLVVETRDRVPSGHLVPVDLVDGSAGDTRLRCTVAEFTALPSSEVSDVPSSGDEQWTYQQEQVLSWPNYTRGPGLTNTGDPVVYHRLPKGNVEIARGDPLHAQDGVIGKIHGLLVDPRGWRVTHVLLDEGHRWSKKQIAIPIRSVTAVHDGVHTGLTGAELRSLPSMDSDHDPQ